MAKPIPVAVRSKRTRVGVPAVIIAILSACAHNVAVAQEIDDVNKPLAPQCAGEGPVAGNPTTALPTLDEWIDTTNACLGFVTPAGSTGDEKAAGESCNTEDSPLLPEEPYGKTDDPQKLFGTCAFPAVLSVQAGVDDHYALPYDPANLTDDIVAAAGVPDLNRWIGFDSNQANRHFGHRFELDFTPVFGYQTGILTIYLRPLNDIPSNDTISLWVPAPAGTQDPPLGWGASLAALGVVMEPGRETILQLDLRTLRTGPSTILADINRYRALNVYIQDDMSIDYMTLTLACGDSGVPAPIVGVIMGTSGCASLRAYDVFLDNEDQRNANTRGGWIGATISNKNTQFRLCALDGRAFTPAAVAGANFALVALSKACPDGFTRFDRFHDNEDNRPQSWDNAPGGSPTYTVQPEKNTNMAFCVATGTNPAVTNAAFPELGTSYGVFGGRTPSISRWALERGFVFLDDEDRRNRNAPASPPVYTREFLVPGANTTYFLARVK